MKKCSIALFLFALCAFCLPVPFAQADGVQTMQVEAQGTGKTRAEAVRNALVEALEKTSGVQITAAEVAAVSSSVAAAEMQDEDGKSSVNAVALEESQESLITRATSGRINGYEIVSEQPSTMQEGMIDVIVLVSYSKFEASKQTQRKRLAVLPFDIATREIEGLVLGQFEVYQELVSYFTQTRRFAVLDRVDVKKRHNEYKFLQGDDVLPAERARMGNALGTDLIIYGIITKFTVTEHAEQVPYVNEIRHWSTADVELSWKIMDTATGQLVSSAVYRNSIDVPKNESWENALARHCAEHIGRSTMDIIYPLMPLHYRDGVLVIPQGGTSVKVGERYRLIKYGEFLHDPYTKELAGRDEIPVGMVEIIDVTPKTSRARVLECSVDLSTIEPRQYILRLLVKENTKHGKKAKKAAQPTQQPAW